MQRRNVVSCNSNDTSVVRPFLRATPVADVAQAGGWESTETLARCYQQPDDATTLAVVLGGAELREVEA